MWRKAFLAVCLCLRWGAALGGESGTRGHRAAGPTCCTWETGLGEAWRERGVCSLSFVKLSRGAWDAAGPGCRGVGLEGAGERQCGGTSILLGETWSLFRRPKLRHNLPGWWRDLLRFGMCFFLRDKVASESSLPQQGICTAVAPR